MKKYPGAHKLPLAACLASGPHSACGEGTLRAGTGMAGMDVLAGGAGGDGEHVSDRLLAALLAHSRSGFVFDCFEHDGEPCLLREWIGERQ